MDITLFGRLKGNKILRLKMIRHRRARDHGVAERQTKPTPFLVPFFTLSSRCQVKRLKGERKVGGTTFEEI
jgi:hypothetical protein